MQTTADKFKDFSLNAWRMTVKMRTVQEVFQAQAQAKIAKAEKEQAALRENLQTGYAATAVALLRVGQVGVVGGPAWIALVRTTSHLLVTP